MKRFWMVVLVGLAIIAIIAFWGCSDDASIAITAITANPTTVLPGGSSTISATVDYEGDETISYDWSCASGTISGAGSSVSWIAPDELGNYTINLTASDGDVSDDGSVVVTVDTSAVPPDTTDTSAVSCQIEPNEITGLFLETFTQYVHYLHIMNESSETFIIQKINFDLFYETLPPRASFEFLEEDGGIGIAIDYGVIRIWATDAPSYTIDAEVVSGNTMSNRIIMNDTENMHMSNYTLRWTIIGADNDTLIAEATVNSPY